MGRGVPLPSRLGRLGERRELPCSGVRGGAPAENEFGAQELPLVAIILIIPRRLFYTRKLKISTN